MLDWEPSQKAITNAATAEKPVSKPAETAKVEEPAKKESKETIASGYTIAFGNVKIVFEGISANDASRQNAEKQDGLSYVVKSGKLSASKIRIYGVKEASIKQRYQSRLMLSSDLGSVDLRNLGLYMSEWKTIPAAGASTQPSFALNDLNKITFSSVNNNKIKNATDKELRHRHTNHKTTQSWMKEISKTRNANDEPCEIILDNLQLQISGTAADGKPFRKNIRMSV